MPLTPAEKMKRYREKLKKDPDRYEEYKKRDLNRMKLKNKKIKELSLKEKVDQRKRWREQKRRQKAKKTESGKTESEKKEKKRDSPAGTSCMNKNHMLMIRKLRRAYESAINKNALLLRNIEKYRKQMYRMKVKHLKEIKRLNETILKMKAREEVIESALRSAYNNTKGHRDKRAMKRIADTVIVKQNKCKTYVGKLMGLKGRVRKVRRSQKSKIDKMKEEMRLFFTRDDISRSTSGKKECKTINKERIQIRYLTDKLSNLYQIYKAEGGTVSFTTFFRYKPAYILSPNIHNRNTCLCIKHSNMDMLFMCLLRNGIFPNDVKSITDVISKSTCDPNSYECMRGICTICKELKLVYALQGEALSKKVFWEQWERVDHNYDKMENGVLKQISTKRTVKNRKHDIITDVIKLFEKNLRPFKIHIYNWKHQQRKYRDKIENLGDNEALILCDFSENYECKSAEEVQATHFGASKHQITLHCGMIYWASGAQSFCSVSDSKCHDPRAIWAHLLPVIELLNLKCPGIKRIHFFSDGPSSQYRQKKNFHLLNFFTTKLGLDMCTWNFSECGHGKGVADGIGGSVKRTLDKQVAYGRDVTNGKQALTILQSTSKTIRFFYIENSEIELIQNSLPVAIKAVPGTLQIHQVLCFANSLRLLSRVLSCFCVIDKEHVCKCYECKEHTLQNFTINKNCNSISMPSTSNIASKQNISEMPESLEIVTQNSEDFHDIFNNLNPTNNLTEIIKNDTPDLPILLITESDNISLCSDNAWLSYDLTYNENDGQAVNQLKKKCLTDIRVSSRNTNPSIKTVVSRNLECFACKKKIIFSMAGLTKCISCLKWFCKKCSEGNNNIDFICRKCFGEEYL